jgi:hypothetical protein
MAVRGVQRPRAPPGAERLSASGRLMDSDQVFNETGETWVNGLSASSRLSKLANSAAAANLSWNLESRRSIPRGFCSRDA